MTSCLIIKNDGIGDLIMASGLIAQLAERFDAVDLVTCAVNKGIAQAIPGLRTILYTSRESLTFAPVARRLGLLRPTGSADDKRLLASLGGTTYDTAITLRRYIRKNSLVLMNAVRAGQRHCCWQIPTNISQAEAQRCSRGWTRHTGNPDVLSEMAYYAEFLEHVFGAPFDTAPRLDFVAPGSSAPEAGTIGLCIGGNRKWPIGYWLDLIPMLLADGWKVALFGGGDAKPLAEALVQRHPECEDQVGKLNFVQSKDRIRNLSVFLGNDTGLTHLAAMLVPHTVVVMGGGGFGRFFPWPETEGSQFVIHHGLDCYDCSWACKYRDRRCIEFIRASDVYGYLKDILDGRGEPVRNLNPHCEGYRQVLRDDDGQLFVPFSRFAGAPGARS